MHAGSGARALPRKSLTQWLPEWLCLLSGQMICLGVGGGGEDSAMGISARALHTEVVLLSHCLCLA